MITRRGFLAMMGTGVATLPGVACTGPVSPEAEEPMVKIKPYLWEGPYAEFRNHGAKHDAGLCADVRAAWMAPEERIIVRSSEIVGYDTAFLYDDHLPPAEPEGRGKDYQSILFQWNDERADNTLSADCRVPGKGRFWLRLRPDRDYVDIELGIHNDLSAPMRDIDWHFCVVGYESPSIGDPEQTRTYLYDGQRLRSLKQLGGEAKMIMYKVAGGHGFIPAPHRALPEGSAEAKSSVVIVESRDGGHAVALGFEQSYAIYGDRIGNKCFHADPYFGTLQSGEERVIRGRLYLMKGTAEDAFERYRREVANSFRSNPIALRK